jgi:hypothetical protein
LRELGPENRKFVMLAAVRGKHLWSGVRTKGVNLDQVLMEWLMANRCTIMWARWIAEDAVYGPYSWNTLIKDDDFDRTLLRLPMWLASGKAFRGGVYGALGRHVPTHRRHEAFEARLGSSGLPPIVIRSALSGQEWIGRQLAAQAARGDYRTKEYSWTPSATQRDQAPRHRRWPIEWIEDNVILCCTLCGEGLPADGACMWCGTDPDEPTELPIDELFAQRPLCPVCGIDYTASVVPVLCPGCGTEFEHRLT